MSFDRWRSLVDGAEIDVGSAIPDSGLAHQWNTDEGSGATLVDSNGGLDGTINGATWQSGAGTNNAYLDYDGVDDHTDLGEESKSELSYLVGTTGSIGFWFNTSDDSRQVIMGNAFSSAEVCFGFRIRDDMNLGFTMSDGSEFDSIRGGTVPTNEWVFGGYRMDGSTRYLYINDTQVASQSIARSTTNDLTSDVVTIGDLGGEAGQDIFTGGIDIGFTGPTDIGDQGMKDWYSDTQEFYL